MSDTPAQRAKVIVDEYVDFESQHSNKVSRSFYLDYLEQLIEAALAASPVAVWTKDRPDKPGWYWFRDEEGIRYMTVILEKSAISGDVLWGTGMTSKGSISSARIEKWEGEFAGPIPPAEEGGGA